MVGAAGVAVMGTAKVIVTESTFLNNTGYGANAGGGGAGKPHFLLSKQLNCRTMLLLVRCLPCWLCQPLPRQPGGTAVGHISLYYRLLLSG